MLKSISKATLPILLIASLSINLPHASAAIKPGSSCKSLGATSISGEKKFTCVKSGKKLVWNKGTAISKVAEPPIPSPTPSPTASSPTPTPSSTPTGDAVVLRINAALKNELPSVDLSKIDEAVTGKLIVEDGISQQSIQTTKNLMKQLYAAQPVMKLVKPPVVILGHTEAFVKSEFAKVCSNNISWIGTGEQTMDKYLNWAVAGCLQSNPTQIIPMPKGDVVVNHIARALGSDMGYVAIGLGPNTSKLPGWFVRGLKGVVGEYMASQGKSDWQAEDNGAINCIDKTLLQVSDSYENTRNWCQTSLGQSISRYMVALKGLNKTLEFINELQVKGTWSESDFETFLGMPFKSFETDAKEYISRLAKK